MLYREAREEILDVCKKMVEEKCFLGTWGNVSMRVNDHILLTPSRVEYDRMTAEDIVLIDLNGNIVEGNRTPTSEKEIHRRIYLVREDVKAIIHAHTEKAMAVSVLPIPAVPCMVEEMSQLLGGRIPLTGQYVPAEQHQKLGETAAAAIGDKNGVILRNHGPVSCGRTMQEAELAVKVLEKSCSIYLSVNDRFFKEIPAGYVESERYRFLYKYGHEKT